MLGEGESSSVSEVIEAAGTPRIDKSRESSDNVTIVSLERNLPGKETMMMKRYFHFLESKMNKFVTQCDFHKNNNYDFTNLVFD